MLQESISDPWAHNNGLNAVINTLNSEINVLQNPIYKTQFLKCAYLGNIQVNIEYSDTKYNILKILNRKVTVPTTIYPSPLSEYVPAQLLRPKNINTSMITSI
jgi:hypothetical protein